MFYVALSLASRFLYLRNILQGFARGILFRSLDTISSHLIPALPPPPPVPRLDAPVPFVERPEEIILPYPSGDLIAIERQFPVFASPLPIYQSSLIAVTPSQFPKFLPVFVILAVISGFVIVLPEIAYFYMNIAKIPSAFAYASRTIAKLFKFKPTFRCLPHCLPSQFAASKLPISLISLVLLWTGPPAIATVFTFIWFTSILFSYEQVSNMIVAILRWCGLLTVQDTRTPPLLDAIYEQITRGAAGYSDLAWCSDLSDEHNNDQVTTDWSLGYSHLAARLAAHELDLRNARVQRENQGREVAVQRIYTEFISSLDRQLEFSSAREQKLHADLHASEQDRGRLVALVSSLEASCRDQQGWEQSAAKANARCAEVEMTASNLRADLAAATDRVREVEEQLEHEKELASGKDTIIQSITEESQWTYTRLRLSKDMIKRRDKLLDERDRRLHEMKELLDEKAMIQDRCESEMRRLRQEAQGQLDTLRDALSQLHHDRRSPLDNDHRLRYQPPTTWPYDTGQPSLPPDAEQILDTGTPPISSAINPNPSLRFTKWSPPSHSQEQEDSSTRRLDARLHSESKVAKKRRAARRELTDRRRPVEPASAGDMKLNERDETRLQEELVAAKEQVRLSEEEVRDLRRELDRSREAFCQVETRVRALECELDICQAKLQEARDAQHASEVNFAEAAQLLRVHQFESESSMAKAEESQFKCSQVTFLCAALQEHVTELEAEVKKLKSARKYRTHSKSSSRRPTDTCTGPEDIPHDPEFQGSDSIYLTISPSMPNLLESSLPPSSPPSQANDSSLYLSHWKCSTKPLASADSGSLSPTDKDPERNTHDTDAPSFDSIFMTIPSSMPCLLDSSLPPSSSQHSSSSLYFSHPKHSDISPTCIDSQLSSPADIDLDVVMPNADSQILDLSLSPQEPTDLCHRPPSPSEVFSLPPFHLPRTLLSERNSLGSVDWPPIGSSLLPEDGTAPQDDNINIGVTTELEEKATDSILLGRRTLLSPIEELNESEVLGRHTSLDSGSSGAEVAKTVADHTPDAPPICLPSLALQVDIPVTPERRHSSRDHVSSSRIADLPSSVFPRITLPPFSLPPSGIHNILQHHLASSVADTVTEVGSAAPDPPLDGLSSSAQNGGSNSTVLAHQGPSSFSQADNDKMPRNGTLSTLSADSHFSRRTQDGHRAAPAHHVRSKPFNTAGSAGVTSNQTPSDIFSLLVHPPPDVQTSVPAHLEARGKPTAVLRSRHRGMDLEAGPLSRRTTVGSLPSCTSTDQGTSMRARRRRRDTVPQPNNVISTRSDLAPPSDNFPATTSRSSGLPMPDHRESLLVHWDQSDFPNTVRQPFSQLYNLPGVSSARKDAKTQAVKRMIKSAPQPSSSPLVPELLDQAFIALDETSVDPPSTSRKTGKGRRRDTSSPDYRLPSFGNVALERKDHDFEDFVFSIPPDCPMSTPVASRKLASRRNSVG